MSRKLFIFDCFGVIFSEVSTLFLNNHLNAEQQLYMRKNIYRKLDLGKMSMDEMFEDLSARCGMTVEQAKQEWASYEELFTDTVEVIKRLREQGHCVALLSNAAVDYIDYLFNKFDMFKYFDRIFVSANYGYAKPDKEFYKLCVDSFDEQFDVTYFTDDNPVNLQDLEQFGITPVLFKNAQDFAKKVGV